MKKLIIKKIFLLSVRDKKGRIIEFDEGQNVILGQNDTGKSSLLKSIYYAFGTETGTHPMWKQSNPIVIVEFNYNEEAYEILRDMNRIVLFDSNKKILNYSESVTKEFSPFFKEFFDLNIELTNRSNEKQQATPAFLFLPFYIDQDQSWNKNWNSFTNLTQFKSWRNDIVSFHTGLRPGRYYLVKSKKDKLNEEKKKLEIERNFLEKIKNKSLEHFKDINLDISFDEFKEEIIKLLEELNKVKGEISIEKEKLKDLYNQKQIILDNVHIAEKSLTEINADYQFCLNKLEHDVECPTCGASYENSFSERFSIAKDEDTCLNLIQELKTKLNEINSKVIVSKNGLLKKNESNRKIEELLKTKKEQITFIDVINSKGHTDMLEFLNSQIKDLKDKIAKALLEIKDLAKELRIIDSPERKKRIEQDYLSRMKRYLSYLNVNALPEETYKKLDCTIHEKGSDLPRALLGYYFSVLNVISKNKEMPQFPIIIDAPKQQEQDKANEKKILKFIRDEAPTENQLILGVVDLDGVEFKANNIVLNKKNSLMNEENYNECLDYFRKLTQKIESFTNLQQNSL